MKPVYIALVTCSWCHQQITFRHAWLDGGEFDHHAMRLHLRLCDG